MKHRSSNFVVVFISRVAILVPASVSPFACKIDASCLIFFLSEKNYIEVTTEYVFNIWFHNNCFRKISQCKIKILVRTTRGI